MSGARRFSKVSPAVWNSKRLIGLSSSDEKLLYFYFLTSEHATSAGAYRIKEGYAISDLGWTANQYQVARAALIAASLIGYDEGCEEVCIERWFVHNPPQNEKHSKGTRRLLEELDSEVIREKMLGDLDAVDRWCTQPGFEIRSPALRGQLASGSGRHQQ